MWWFEAIAAIAAIGARRRRRRNPKRILILGGTGFLGPKTIDAALARGHSITIFNRGKREKLQPLEQKVEHLYGNRDPKLPADEANPEGSPVGLAQLEGKKWDVVIDNSGYFPRHVEASAKLLAPNAERYIYISSISAYAEYPPAGGDETTQLAELADPTVETMGEQFENYGGLKVLCERAVDRRVRRRSRRDRSSRLHRRSRRSDRSLHVLARAHRGRWRSARARLARRSAAMDRRARSRRVARHARRARHDRHVQRGRSRNAGALGHGARHVRRRRRRRRRS